MKTCSAAPLGRADSSEKKTKTEGKKGAKSAARQGKEGEKGDDPVHLCARVS